MPKVIIDGVTYSRPRGESSEVARSKVEEMLASQRLKKSTKAADSSSFNKPRTPFMGKGIDGSKQDSKDDSK